MKAFKVAAGTTGSARNLKKYCSFTPWTAYTDLIFTESEFRGSIQEIKDPKYLFVRGMTEICVPAANVAIV